MPSSADLAAQADLVVDRLASRLELLLVALLGRVEDPARDTVMQVGDFVGHGSHAFDYQGHQRPIAAAR